MKSSLFDVIDNVNLPIANFAIFDLETTGLDPVKDDIIEIAIMSLKNNEVKNTYHSYAKTSKEITAKITSINRITNELIEKSPPILDILNYIYTNYSNSIMIAHNCFAFDAKFIINKSPNLFTNFSFLDTKVMAKDLLPGLKSHSMTSLCELFGIEIINQHTAIGDTEALSKLFIKLIKLLDSPNDIEKYIRKGFKIKT